MTQDRDAFRSLLVWYPATWRERYGDEFLALVRDQDEERPVNLTLKLSIARSGIRERVLASHLVGARGSKSDQSFAGAFLVLGAWTAIVIAGAGFSKITEHTTFLVPRTSRVLTQDFFNAVTTFGASGVVVVTLGALFAIPHAMGFLRRGGWRQIQSRLAWTLIFGLTVVMTTVPLVWWAQRISSAQRNGADPWYSILFVVWASLIAMTLAQVTMTVVVIARRGAFSRAILRCESALAIFVAIAMTGVSVFSVLWMVSIWQNAPWVLSGDNNSHVVITSTHVILTLGTLVLMVTATVTALYGAFRVARSWTVQESVPLN